MIESSLRVRDDLVADSASYNMLLTTLLRAELGRPSVQHTDARGYATGGRILQGFGLVTATHQARDVVNLASRASEQRADYDVAWAV
jgi:hypothetical protein